MSYADKVFINMCRDILDNGTDTKDELVRPKWEDGTPAYTIKKFCVVNRYNLAEEFPALTLRKTAFKSCVDEILWIWQKKSNDLAELNSHIWDEWGHPEFDRRLIVVQPRQCNKPTTLASIKVADIQREYTEDEVHHSNYGDFIILEINNKKYTIQFLNTGAIRTVSQSTVSAGEVKDFYCRTVCGIGYYGDWKADDIKQYFGKYHHRWVNTWENMIHRCNGSYSGNENLYKDVFVTPEFHCCETFLRWVMNNNKYKEHDMLGVLQLDKDYYGAKCYSPDTCVLITPKQNTWLTSKQWFIYHDIPYYGMADLAKQFYAEGHNCFTPSGTYNDYAVKKLIKAYETTGELHILSLQNEDGTLNRFPIGPKYTILKAYGWQLAQKYVHHTYPLNTPLIDIPDLTQYPSAELIFNYNAGKALLYMNQVDGVIFDLRNNPYSRRIMTNLYNFTDLHEMALYPCAYSMTFNVTKDPIDNKLVLNGILNQRSQDVLAANNWNVVQYSVLLHMIAQVCDMKVGEFVHVIADCHIYDRHVDTIKTLIKREPLPAPTFWINPEIKNFYDFTTDDVKLIDYNTHPQIKGIPVAI